MGCVLGKQWLFGESPAPRKSSISSAPAAAAGAVDVASSARPPPPPASHHSRSPVSSSPMKEQLGWPAWLLAVAGDSLRGWTPRRPDSFKKLGKIGSGTYSNVYKAQDLETGRMVALKKVRFEAVEPESVRFMAREIRVLRRLNHPNVVRLEGLVLSRVMPALYLVFEYMEHDLAGLAAAPGVQFSESQIKCYMKQLLSGLEHCHSQGVLHRDIKGSNLLIDNNGILKIADFGLACTFDPDNKQPMTSRVVTLWYRAPELLLGSTYYGVGVDLWSAGCILAELLLGNPIFPGRTEVEQLHKIFRLCGSPSEKYWKNFKFPRATILKPKQKYARCISETFKDFPTSSVSLVDTLLSLEPSKRGTATAALNSAFFTTEPFACDPSSLPQYPPSKEMDAILRDDEKARRQKKIDEKGKTEATRRLQAPKRRGRAIPAPEANAELQVNLDRRRLMNRVNVTSKSEKFPPPHQDGAVGISVEIREPYSFVGADSSFASSIFETRKSYSDTFAGTPASTEAGNSAAKRIGKKEERQIATSQAFTSTLDRLLMEQNRKTNVHRAIKGKELEVFESNK